ncbi:hypothetical protein D3C85_813760 [compost metagenome]
MITLGCNEIGVAHAFHILPARAFQVQDGIVDHLAIGGGRLVPVLADRRPGIPQAFEIGIAVLRNDRADPLRVRQRQAQADRRPIVEEVHPVTLEAQHIDELADRLADGIEGVDVVAFGGHLGETETGQIRRNQAVFVGEPRDQVPELVR